MRVLDLCSGTGSATRPFAEAGWDVATLDCDPYWRPTILADVRTWPAPAGATYDVIWASPPCTAFSRLDQPGLYPDEPQTPDLSIATACVQQLQPRVWWLENVRGARAHFAPLLGSPTCHLGPWWLWTNCLWLRALDGRPRKSTSGYQRGAHRRLRLAVHPGVAAAVYRCTVAALGDR